MDDKLNAARNTGSNVDAPALAGSETSLSDDAQPVRAHSTIVVRSPRRSRSERAGALRTDLTRLFHGADDAPYMFWCSGLRPLATRLTMIGHIASAPTLSRAMPLTGAWHVEGNDEGAESESDRIGRYTRIGARINAAHAQKIPVLAARVLGADGSISGGSALPFVESLVRAWRAQPGNEAHIRVVLLTDGSLDRSRKKSEEWMARLATELRMSIELVTLPKGYVLWRRPETEISRVGMTAGARSLTVALSSLDEVAYASSDHEGRDGSA